MKRMTEVERRNAEPYAPTGPGEYMMRDGNKATLLGKHRIACAYPWVGDDGKAALSWTASGQYNDDGTSYRDIIGPWPTTRTWDLYVAAFQDRLGQVVFDTEPSLQELRNRWSERVMLGACKVQLVEGEGMDGEQKSSDSK